MGLFRGLSGRLLVLTVAVVMVVEVIVFVPSVARFRQDYLEERIARAHLSALAVMAAPDFMVTKEMERALLDGAGVRNVVLVREGARALILTSPGLGQVAESFDLRGQGAGQTIADALSRLVRPSGAEVIRVIGATPEGGPPGQAEALEITLDAAPLRVAMLDYGLRVLNLSLVISLFTATVVFLVIRRVVVSPLVRLSGAVRRFQDDPEDPAREIRPSGGAGEVAEAEAAIAAMQADVRRALAERARLASLGTALSKISHDLRNMLAAQLLMTDRLGRSSDPVVMRVAPKLIGALERAIRLCQRTLDYGTAEEAAPERREVVLSALIEEVGETLGLDDTEGAVRLIRDIPEGHTVPADPEQLYRVLSNLMRNAAEAIQATARPGEIRICAAREDTWSVIRLCDTGPGLPERARTHLFQPFQGSARRGGTGLGLSIAHDLIKAHGGRLHLVSSTTEGSVFEIRLPMSKTGRQTGAGTRAA